MSALALLSPVSAIALGALIVFGTRALIPVALGAMLAGLGNGLEPGAALVNAGGHTVAAFAGAWLVRRFARGTRAFDQPRTTGLYALIAAAVSAPIACSAGVAALISSGRLPATGADHVWLSLWWRDIAAMLSVAPALMLWSPRRRRGRGRRRGDPRTPKRGRSRTLEAAALSVAAILASLIMFGGWIGTSWTSNAAAVLPFPVLIWAALRFGPRETATVMALFAGMAAWSVARDHGAPGDLGTSLRWLQVFLASTSVTALVTAAAIDQRNRAGTELHLLAVTDPLTGLANQRHLRSSVEREILRSQRSVQPFALLMMDVDDLKITNDQLGHGVGSRLLSRVAEALRMSCRESDLICRYGGDEFAVLLKGCHEPDARAQVARVLEALAADTESPRLSVSIGLAMHPRDGDSCDELIDRADEELYAMKRSRKGGHGPQAAR